MSSPKTASAKPAKAAPAKVSRGFDKLASDAGMSKNDKANFIKAMMEGVQPKPAKPVRKAATSRVEKPVADAPKKVEILRRIPAPQQFARPSNPESEEAIKLARMLEKKLAAGDHGVLTPEAVQSLMTALCKLYSAEVDAGNKYPVVNGRMAISGTDAMILCGALLKAVDLQVFELGMWQSWSGI